MVRSGAASTTSGCRYRLFNLRVRNPRVVDSLRRYSWPELRELIYGDPRNR